MPSQQNIMQVIESAISYCGMCKPQLNYGSTKIKWHKYTCPNVGPKLVIIFFGVKLPWYQSKFEKFKASVNFKASHSVRIGTFGK